MTKFVLIDTNGSGERDVGAVSGRLRRIKVDDHVIAIELDADRLPAILRKHVKIHVTCVHGMLDIMRRKEKHGIRRIIDVHCELRLCETVCKDGVTRYIGLDYHSTGMENGLLKKIRDGYSINSITFEMGCGSGITFYRNGLIETNDEGVLSRFLESYFE